jgi:bifunctional oligoribonuclease and PAP phosphatase NrnA
LFKKEQKVEFFKNSRIFKPEDTQLPKVLSKRIDSASSVVIASHVNPDGDALGSSLALYHYLKKTGKKQVSVIMPNQYPDFLKWLPGNDDIIIFNKDQSIATRTIRNSDLIFLLDFNTPERTDKAEKEIAGSGAYKIMIDHHPNPVPFTDVIISDTMASSTAELVFRFIENAGIPGLIDHVSATCLYAGIMSDTGSFNYNSSQPETYRVLAELLERGIDKDHIYSSVYDNFSENRMRLLGYCLDKKMVVYPEYQTAFMSLSLAEKKHYNYKRGDAEGFVNYPLSVKGIIFVAFFMENDDHIKISFRSKGGFDTNKFAVKYFDGGGHVNASGGESRLSLNETIKKFVSLLPEYIPKTENVVNLPDPDVQG